MKHLKLCAATLALLLTSACETLGTPPIADSACVVFRPISYAIPPVQVDGSRKLADDPGNRYDTEETTKEAQDHNARFGAVCK